MFHTSRPRRAAPTCSTTRFSRLRIAVGCVLCTLRRVGGQPLPAYEALHLTSHCRHRLPQLRVLRSRRGQLAHERWRIMQHVLWTPVDMLGGH